MYKMKNIITLLLISTTIFSCQSNLNDVTEKDIDKLVEAILDSNQVYDIAQSLRFSNDTEHYNVVEYSQNDTSKLFVESYFNNESEYTRQLYLNNGKVIFVKEMGYQFIADVEEEYELKIYVFDDEHQQVYKKILDPEAEVEPSFEKFNETLVIDADKPKNAILQKGEFELKFGEFLIIEPQSYLILENKESNYNVALFIMEGDYLLDELYTNPEKYKGKTIFANHEFVTMAGVERMVYRGGILIEN